MPMRGEKIGQFIARAIAGRAARRCPWYEPTESILNGPLLAGTMLDEFDTLVVEAPFGAVSPGSA